MADIYNQAALGWVQPFSDSEFNKSTSAGFYGATAALLLAPIWYDWRAS